MKSTAFTFAVIADQVSSRTGDDRVPAALAGLAELDTLLSFERTAGDEIQGLIENPATVIAAVAALTRHGGWRLGVGVGPVDLPLPSSTRAARGPVYLAARAAIEAARKQPAALALRLPEDVGSARYGGDNRLPDAAEAALWLWRGQLARRSQEGWELMDLLDSGLTRAEAARALGVSASAVSQRAAAAAREEMARGAALCEYLLTELIREP